MRENVCRKGEMSSVEFRFNLDEMRKAAVRQEWYDYELFGDGDFVPHERRRIYDSDGNLK